MIVSCTINFKEKSKFPILHHLPAIKLPLVCISRMQYSYKITDTLKYAKQIGLCCVSKTQY